MRPGTAAESKEHPADVSSTAEMLSNELTLNFNTGFSELIDLICGFGFSRPAWHYAYGV